jgi:hypothetical protein
MIPYCYQYHYLTPYSVNLSYVVNTLTPSISKVHCTTAPYITYFHCSNIHSFLVHHSMECAPQRLAWPNEVVVLTTQRLKWLNKAMHGAVGTCSDVIDWYISGGPVFNCDWY